MGNPKDRPIKTCAELCEAGSPSGTSQAALMTAKEFVKMASLLSGQKTTRGNLQFYSSPALRILPLPIYLRRHTAYYLHPENTVRFAVLLHLRAAYFLPLDLVKVVLDGLKPEHYSLILDDILSASDIVRLAREGEPKAWLKDVLAARSARALQVARLIKDDRGPAEADANDPAVQPCSEVLRRSVVAVNQD